MYSNKELEKIRKNREEMERRVALTYVTIFVVVCGLFVAGVIGLLYAIKFIFGS